MNKGRKAKKAKQIATYYYERDNFEKALPNYVRAVSFKDTRPYFDEESYHSIAYCYYEIGDLDKALLYITECLNISSGYLDGKMFYGKLLIDMGKKAQGEKIIAECDLLQEEIKTKKLDLDAFYNTK